MFKAILFDLDGTLLDINMDVFIRQYFSKWWLWLRKPATQWRNVWWKRSGVPLRL